MLYSDCTFWQSYTRELIGTLEGGEHDSKPGDGLFLVAHYMECSHEQM